MDLALSPAQQESLFAICVAAAFADGAKGENERTEIKRIADELLAPDFPTAGIYQRVLLGQQSVEASAAALDSPGLRALAYEMAVGVCDADDATSDPERDFLRRLAAALGLGAEQAQRTEADAAAVALAPVQAPGLEPAPVSMAVAPDSAAASGLAPALSPTSESAPADPREAEADGLTLKYAILNGALELLPESLATMAIVPLQMKLVYRIGAIYGVALDRGHIKEFLAAAGVGLTSQVVEGFARKILRGVVGRSIGKLGRSAVDQVASSAFSFGSTYALGMVARRYYAGGRTLNGAQLRDGFTTLTEKARGLHAQYLPQIRSEAAQLNVGKILASVRGG